MEPAESPEASPGATPEDDADEDNSGPGNAREDNSGPGNADDDEADEDDNSGPGNADETTTTARVTAVAMTTAPDPAAVTDRRVVPGDDGRRMARWGRG